MTLTLDIAVTSAILVLVVAGLLLIFGLLHVINLAHTGLMAIGAFMQVEFVDRGVGFWLGLLLSALVTGAVGAVIEIAVVRRLYERPLDTILATWGVSLVITQVLILVYGSGTRSVDFPAKGATSIFGTVYPTYRLLLIVIAAVLLAGLGLLVWLTPAGLIIRAVMVNEPLARAHGINTVRVRQITFIVGSALAGAAGAVIAPTTGVDTSFGTALVATGLLAALLAGRTLPGLALAAVLLGGAQILFARYANPIWGQAFVIGLAVVVLRFVPNGFTFRRTT